MSPRTQAKLHWFLSVTIAISLLIPIIEPLFAQSAGWLPPADPALQTVPEYRDEGYEPWVPEEAELVVPKTPSFSLPTEADEVSELIPTHLAQLVAVHDEVAQSEVAQVTEQGATVSFLDGRVTIIADANSFAEPVTLALKPHFALDHAEQNEEITPAGETSSPTEGTVPVEEAEQNEKITPAETPSSTEETLSIEEETVDNGVESETSESSPVETPVINAPVDSNDGLIPLPAPNPDPSEWLEFEIEAFRTSDGQPVPLFDKELYMVIDLRDMYPEVLGSSWFLRFQDEEDPALWRNTPLTIYDEAGLFSTTTDHFSTWNAGYEPSAWRYQWNVPTVSTFSGAATFSYPIEVPVGRGGLTPNIDISYSSRGVDTLIFSDGMDQMPLGLGWNINNIEITRDNPHPKDDGAHVFMQHPARFSLVFNGNSYQLELMSINNSSGIARYYAINNPSLKIEHRRHSSAGNADKLYWRVVDGSGTVYRLGYTADAESHHWGYIDNWGNGTAQLIGTEADSSGVRWRVDTITDVHGNQIQYSYITSSQTESYQSTSGTWTYFATPSSRIREIRYNHENLAANTDARVSGGTYANRILFEPSTYHPINQINLYQVDLSTPYSRIKIGTGTYPTSNNACGQGARESRTNVVSSIRQENGDGSLYLPQTTFSYWVASNGTHNNECFRFYRLQEVNNGYGGRIRFTYDTDNRIQDWWTWQSGLLPAYGRTFFVTQVETWDGLHTNPAVTDYEYQTPCYDQYDAVGSGLGTLPNAFNCPSRPWMHLYGNGKLVGFNTATVTQKDYDGQILRRTDTAFHQDSLKTGWPSWQEVRDPSGFVLQKQETTYSRDVLANTFDFSFASQVTNIQYVRGGESTQHTTQYEYARQGNVQYGNLTAVRETGYIGGIGNNERHVLRDYYPNTGAWIVNAVAREQVLGPSNALQTETRNYYDGSSAWNAIPSKGNLTLVSKLKDLPSTFITVQTIAYDPIYSSNVVSTYDGRNNPTTIAYDTTFKLLPVTITNAANHTQQIQYFGFHGVPNQANHVGLVKQVSDANNSVTSYEYDPFRRLTKVIRPEGDTSSSPSEVYTYYDYGSQRLYSGPFMISSWTKTQNAATAYSPGGVFERNFYDGFGNVVQTQRPHTNWNGGGVGQEVVVDMEYNALGQMMWQNSPYLRNAYTYGTTNGLVNNPFNTPNLSQPRVSHTYSALGQTVRSVNLDGGVTSAVYGYLSTYTQDANFNVKAAYTDIVGQLVAVDEMTNRYSDTFDNATLPNWTKNGIVVGTSGLARLTGDGTWNSYITRNLNYAGENEDGISVSFRTSNANSSAHLYLDYGAWNTANYRRWSLTLTGGNFVLQQFTGTASTNQTLMPVKANTWYRVMLIKGRGGISHRLVVWEQDNPAIFAEVRLAKDTSWQQNSWRFVAQMYTSGATLDVDNYAQFNFYRTNYKYDLLGNLKEVVDPLNNKTEMWYDALGRKTSMRDLDMTNPANSSNRWWYTYDNAGNLTQQTDAKGQVITFGYDNLNRLTTKKQGSTTLATYVYDVGTNGKGQRTSMTSYVGETNSASWVYDARGRVTDEYRSVAAGNYRFQFTYSQGDLPLTVRYPAGTNNQLGETVTTNYYWQTGQPKTLAGDSTYVNNTTYNQFGLPTQMNLGPDTVIHTLGYDVAMRPTTLRYKVAGIDRFHLSLNYDKNSNITSIVDWISPNGASQNQNFAYDSLNRLTSAYTTGGTTASYNQTYAYDILGNLVQKAGVNMGYGQASGIAATAKPHAVTHLNSTQKFWYDHNGNMTTRIDEASQTWTYTWTIENQLATASRTGENISFTYDADGMMILRNDDGQRTVYLGKLYQRKLSTNIEIKHYAFNGKLVAMKEGSGYSFLLTDHLGSVNVTLAADGSVGSRLRYDPWGKQRYAQNVTPTGYRYTSQRFDDQLGLYDYNARYYDPAIGRFISADTIVPNTSRLTPLTVGFHETMFLGQANGENQQLMIFGAIASWSSVYKQQFGVASGPFTPQTLNRYAYAFNNPLTYIDPSGHNHTLPYTATLTAVDPALVNGEEGWYTLRISGEGIETIERLIHKNDPSFGEIEAHIFHLENYRELYWDALESENAASESLMVGIVVAIAALIVTLLGITVWAPLVIAGVILAVVSVFIVFWYGLPSLWSAQKQIDDIRSHVENTIIGEGGLYDTIRNSPTSIPQNWNRT